MVERQVKARGIDDPALLAALKAVPREAFVSGAYSYAAYDDSPLPIEAGQTISQPYIVALMIAAAAVGTDDRVLEVGAGSGYAAAVLGQVYNEHVFVDTVMLLKVDHEVVPSEMAYGKDNACSDCHTGSQIDWAALGWAGDPMDTSTPRPRP